MNTSTVISATPSPRVSIIVVTYNHEAFIDECLASCVMQAADFPGLEIVVSDDGSRDSTPLKIKEWESRHPDLIRPVLAERNQGIAANFNKGLAAAKGELIAWLGGDDIMLPSKIQHQVKMLDQTPDASGTYHDAEVFAWPGGNTLGLFSKLYAGKAAQEAYVDLTRMLDPRYQMLPSTLMVRRSAMPAAFDVRLRFHNDYLFDLETIARGGRFVRMEGVYTRYRKHEKSIGQDPAIRSSMLEENLMVMAIIEARHPGLAAAINRRAIYYLTLEAIRSAKDGRSAHTAALCLAIKTRGALTRSLAIRCFGGLLAKLAAPRHRALAIRIRSLFG